MALLRRRCRRDPIFPADADRQEQCWTALKLAWEYHTGDISDGSDNRRKSEFETTPIVVDGTMYLSTPLNRVVALDPETGREKWSFDPKIDLHSPYSEGLVNRGVTSWIDAARAEGEACHRRIFLATIDARLFALDAATGTPCTDFGAGGQIDLSRGVANITRRGEYEETSAPAVAGDLLIVGSAIADNDRVDSPSGQVRAYEARTGKLRWSWNPIPESIAPTGAGNAWSAISIDIGRDLVIVPTTSASPDYHGFKRPGDNKWADSVVALSAKTGELVWGFQLVHHDLWDYDTAAQPVLATLRRAGAELPSSLPATKPAISLCWIERPENLSSASKSVRCRRVTPRVRKPRRPSRFRWRLRRWSLSA